MHNKQLFFITLLFLFYIPTYTQKSVSTTIFAHGLGRDIYQANSYKENNIIEKEAHAFPLYDELSKVTLGQYHEIEHLATAIKEITNEKPTNTIVLRGISLGAVTIINYLGSCTSIITEIAGAILESPFAEVQDVLNIKIKQSYLLSALNALCPGFNRIGIYFTYKNHDLKGIQPIKVAHFIPKHIPILLIASEADSLVTAHSTLRIYKKLKKSGHTKTHLLMVKHGKHGALCWDTLCGATVRNVEHAFRKKYNLGNYNDAYALAGQEEFARTQPLY